MKRDKATVETVGATVAARILEGDLRRAARLIRDLDDEQPEAQAVLGILLPHTGNTPVVGVTGAPGAGKSSLLDGLVARYRARGDTVGVLAVDPSSPLSGGAVLGDRVRMQRHATDPGVFIRSFASRGNPGGLARATFDAAAVLDAMRFGIVFVETVGVGQDEVDIAAMADVTVVVTVPGLGDGVQAIKAGLLEMADILVVNKVDLPGSDRVVADLEAMLAIRQIGPKDVPIVRTSTQDGRGLEELERVIEAARTSEAIRTHAHDRRLARLSARLRDGITRMTMQRLDALVGGDAGWRDRASAILSGQASLHALVQELADRLIRP